MLHGASFVFNVLSAREQNIATYLRIILHGDGNEHGYSRAAKVFQANPGDLDEVEDQRKKRFRHERHRRPQGRPRLGARRMSDRGRLLGTVHVS